ncbi:HET-domain-containing protein [Trametes coccinea BRFM310]|uniref:HET-domain-containing protein n=1 Tax=Trametes coccinea (strain BRFM310) TaxID=1353009 RepID=A0A1Y2ILI5_TRAC3|nr:HET-domain-containing protein [Trametes coccinea BRFM310]
MWLLDTTTYRLRFEQDPSHVSYTILSHVWDVATEQTYQVCTSSRRLVRELNAKIRDACAYARSRGHRYIWIDTCCIDKTSSAELSEALNSMFDWYSYAEVCYVFLPDVEDDEDPAPSHSGFSCSLWFKRGWTLQELIVPRINIFLSRSWRMLGTKASLAKTIARTTGIDKDILLHKRPLHSISVARRMSWASDRETTRVEDEAYCLMGLFGIRMPTIYGEGRQAFVRLQEEILKRIPDQSLFAWGRLWPDFQVLDELLCWSAWLVPGCLPDLGACEAWYMYSTSSSS